MHVIGNPEQIGETIEVICNGYPEELVFNMETKIIPGKLSYKNKSIHNSTKEAKQ